MEVQHTFSNYCYCNLQMALAFVVFLLYNTGVVAMTLLDYAKAILLEPGVRKILDSPAATIGSCSLCDLCSAEIIGLIVQN